jgi:hypothetical protein
MREKMTQVFNLPIARVFADDGTVGAGYKLYFYETGTTTKKTIYADVGLTIPLTNPVVADANGEFVQIFLEGTGKDYKAILGNATETDPPTSSLWTADPVDTFVLSASSFDPRPFQHWGTTSGTSTQYTLTPADPITSYADSMIFSMQMHIDNTGASTIAISGLSAINLKKYDNTGLKVTLEAGDLQAGQTYIVRIDSVEAVVLNPGIPYQNLANSTKATTTTKGIALLDKYWGWGGSCKSGTNTDEQVTIQPFKFLAQDGLTILELVSVATNLDYPTLNGGALANSTTYHLFRYLKNDDTMQWHLSTSLTPTISNIKSALAYRRILSLKTDGDGDLLLFDSVLISGGGIQISTTEVLAYTGTTPATVSTFILPSVLIFPIITLSAREGSIQPTRTFTCASTFDTKPKRVGFLTATTLDDNASMVNTFSNIPTNNGQLIFTGVASLVDVLQEGYIDHRNNY